MDKSFRRSLMLVAFTIGAASSSQIIAQSWSPTDVDGWRIGGTPFGGCSARSRIGGEFDAVVEIRPARGDLYWVFVEPYIWGPLDGVRPIDLEVTIGSATQHNVPGAARSLPDNRSVFAFQQNADFLAALVQSQSMSIVPAGQSRVEQLRIPLTERAARSLTDCKQFVGVAP